MKGFAGVCLGVSLALATLGLGGCGPGQAAAEPTAQQEAAYKRNIERVLAADDKTGYDANAAHIARMEAIDMTGCPPEFREAYQNHVRAWKTVVAVRQDHERLQREGKFRDTAEAANFQVNETYRIVRGVAMRHGAAMPLIESNMLK